MAIDPQFAQELMRLLGNPPVMCDLAMGALFPDRHQTFQRWVSQKKEPPTYSEVYDFLCELFPSAPKRENVANSDMLFREMFKHMVAEAFQLEYRSAVRLILPSQGGSNG